LECFDVSHLAGTGTVASCVVFGPDGPEKSDYRRFHIEGEVGGDDFAAMAQAVRRRYLRVKRGEAAAPDVLFIDGGRGQLGAACAALAEIQLDGLLVVGVAKGHERRPGRERLFVAGSEGPLQL